MHGFIFQPFSLKVGRDRPQLCATESSPVAAYFRFVARQCAGLAQRRAINSSREASDPGFGDHRPPRCARLAAPAGRALFGSEWKRPTVDLFPMRPVRGFLTGERVVRRLAATLASDVVGYSRLMGRDENGTPGTAESASDPASSKAPYAQPTCFRASPSFQILVMWLILSPLNCIT
jgi:hypothetical protein